MTICQLKTFSLNINFLKVNILDFEENFTENHGSISNVDEYCFLSIHHTAHCSINKPTVAPRPGVCRSRVDSNIPFFLVEDWWQQPVVFYSIHCPLTQVTDIKGIPMPSRKMINWNIFANIHHCSSRSLFVQ